MLTNTDSLGGAVEDPTNTEPLQALKNEVLTDSHVQKRLADLKCKQVALVLSGGGQGSL